MRECIEARGRNAKYHSHTHTFINTYVSSFEPFMWVAIHQHCGSAMHARGWGGAKGRKGMRGAGREQGGPKGRGGRSRGRAPDTRPVDESTELDIKQALESFKADQNEQQLVFSTELSNHDRGLVHKEAKKHGLASKSRGKGTNRQITVYKPERSMPKFVDYAYELPIEQASYDAMSAHFEKFPASEQELTSSAMSAPRLWQPEDEASRECERRKRHKAHTLDVGRSSELSRDEAHAKLADVRAKAPSSIAEQTRSLPVASFFSEIINTVENNQVTIIAGETGCGKTTQVPQYVLDHWLASGRGAYCLCTQPRRISAMSIADRVATERGESVGGAIGYQIRLEAKYEKDTSILFCTNGILLRKLTQAEGSTKELDRVTHVIVDEVHERDMFADFLLIVLKELLQSRPDLKVILMSATMNESMFSEYFGGAPIVRIPGQVYPVSNWHLDDILVTIDWRSSESKQEKLECNGVRNTSRVSRNPPPPSSDVQFAEMENAISEAFLCPSETSFSRLLALASASASSGESLVNVQHRETGACALMAAAGQGREVCPECCSHIKHVLAFHFKACLFLL